MDAIIRPAERKDCAAMLDIYTYYVNETAITFELEPPSLVEFERRFDTYTELFPWFVCEIGDEAVGYSYAYKFKERPAYGWAAECTVYVKNGMHRRGIGRALYACLLDTLKLQGYLTAIGVICVPNENSEALHRFFGFAKQSDIKNVGYKLGEWRDVAWYSVPLGGYPAKPAPPLPIGKVNKTEEFRALLKESAKMVRV
jgi:L-amino acid N-acyltransferase YncA